MRALFVVLVSSFLLPGLALAQTSIVKTGSVVSQDNRLPAHEPDTYRFGMAYLSTRGTTPGQCEAACNSDTQRCAAWTLVPATFQMGPRCELKRNVGAQEYRPGAVSGIALLYQPNGTELQEAFERRTVATQSVRTTSSTVRPAVTRSVPTRPATTTPTVVTRSVTTRPVTVTPPKNPLYRTTNPAPTRSGQAISTTAVTPTPAPKPVTQPTAMTPSPQRPSQFEMQPAAPSTVTAPVPTPTPQVQPLRSEVTVSEPTTMPAPVATVPTGPSGGVQVSPPPAPLQRTRTPWHLRTGNEPDYSVSGLDTIPGDEEATAGLLGGDPEN
ncbi:MAG: hypothetical protein AAF296_08985 [Pseudomonadota bacterium]